LKQTEERLGLLVEKIWERHEDTSGIYKQPDRKALKVYNSSLCGTYGAQKTIGLQSDRAQLLALIHQSTSRLDELLDLAEVVPQSKDGKKKSKTASGIELQLARHVDQLRNKGVVKKADSSTKRKRKK
jgi:hypothetical protein